MAGQHFNCCLPQTQARYLCSTGGRKWLATFVSPLFSERCSRAFKVVPLGRTVKAVHASVYPSDQL